METRENTRVTRVVVELLQDAVHPVLGADGAFLRPHRQAGEPRPQEHRLILHLVYLGQQLSNQTLIATSRDQ